MSLLQSGHLLKTPAVTFDQNKRINFDYNEYVVFVVFASFIY